MGADPPSSDVLVVADMPLAALRGLLDRLGLDLCVVPDGEAIPGSFWGEPEAGLIGRRVFVRSDTPVHSVLHETAHVVCMDGERRAALARDAGGDDPEEAAVCFLQVVLADSLPAGRDRIMRDMDSWGYSFRLGSTRRWFDDDAADARDWLLRHELLDADDRPTWHLRN
ncbi:MAG: hypothetical protein OEW35_04525 [Gammaproteobacteria bacterium]|nr:hypothetical protein [Gammaproteobacteria bacterium]MDH4256141.1 hypothetical protein [Gammaproteobacteria bacterium]MDH5310836.1 hypothetical protein [Gammaproteobacteria bacterium]